MGVTTCNCAARGVPIWTVAGGWGVSRTWRGLIRIIADRLEAPTPRVRAYIYTESTRYPAAIDLALAPHWQRAAISAERLVIEESHIVASGIMQHVSHYVISDSATVTAIYSLSRFGTLASGRLARSTADDGATATSSIRVTVCSGASGLPSTVMRSP